MKINGFYISICICTYKRPELLGNLLKKLQRQKTNGLFAYSIVIVDNDHAQSAKSVVESFKQISSIDIDYLCEPEKNIALARNKAIKNAKGNFVAFIDDDEFPIDYWLVNLFRTLKKYNADGVLGPVNPDFEKEPPKWVLKGKLLSRKSYVTGYVLVKPRDTRTGNVLLNRNIFKKEKNLFDPEYGKTGGEDVDFFRRMLNKHYVFVWCNEATVYETVPSGRIKRAYFLRRALLRGVVNSKHASKISFIKSLCAFSIYTLALPVLFFVAHHLFMKFMIKNCDHLGKLLAIFGIRVVKERTL